MEEKKNEQMQQNDTGQEMSEEKTEETIKEQEISAGQADSDADEIEPAVKETSDSGDEAGEKETAKSKEGDEESPEDAPEGQAEDGEKDKAGLFGKKKKKDKKDEKIEELTDQVKRQMAEFDNFRKRTEKEKTQMYEIGAKSIIEKILPVVDNFERGLAAVPEENMDDAFVDGMNKIYKQMLTAMEEMGVTPIEAVGKQFDPELHNAVMQVESEEYESGVVAQELQKGYKYRDSIVRHSMVAVVS